ncbi:hypothetical protein, partial [Streptomyces harbinensis]|uniref:hypothetical protein n=1 Tax=Streptomyces harbinensis TaxID=1176198 RepID=UPI0034DF936F
LSSGGSDDSEGPGFLEQQQEESGGTVDGRPEAEGGAGGEAPADQEDPDARPRAGRAVVRPARRQQ